MKLNEIEQTLKNIPDELYEIPQYGKLLRNIKVYNVNKSVVLYITLSTGSTVASIHIFEDMCFVCRQYIDVKLINYLKIHIPNIVERISSYLAIFGFSNVIL